MVSSDRGPQIPPSRYKTSISHPGWQARQTQAVLAVVDRAQLRSRRSDRRILYSDGFEAPLYGYHSEALHYRVLEQSTF